MNCRVLPRARALALCAALSGAIVACGRSDQSRDSAAVAEADAPARNTNVKPSPESRPRIVVLGDSLTAGLGLSPQQAYPTLLQQRVDAEGLRYEVVNAGISGDTSAGGLSRLDWALEGDVRVLIVALGGNDALRGLPIEELKRNLSEIVERAQARGVRVIVAGMEAPPNFGQAYIVSFHQIYPDLATKYKIPLVPFLLQGVAGIESLNQRDGIHPTAEGARMVADNVWPVLQPMLKSS
jgi:acyl-CoA thioesterase-1